MGGLSFFIKKIKKIIDKHTEKDYNQLVKLIKRSTKEVQNMKWIVTKFIGTGFDRASGSSSMARQRIMIMEC